MPDPKHTIVCFSSQRWDEPTWTNKQHIMSRLAKEHRVIHLDFEPCNPFTFASRTLRHEPSLLLEPRRWLGESIVQRGPNLYVGTSWGIPGAELFPWSNSVREFSTFERKVRMARRFLSRNGISDPILWVYHPGFAASLREVPRKLLVYDCVDEYTAFPSYRKVKDWIAARERSLCQQADLVFTTAPSLYERKREFNPTATHYVHNVGDAEHFKQALSAETRVPDDLQKLGRPLITFIGAVSNYKLNLDWILELARKRPSYQVALIGPVGLGDRDTNVSALRALPNVHLLGVRSYQQLPAYLKGSDVAVIPYRLNDYTDSVFPIKFFEFMATGKPVVVSRLPSLAAYFDAVRVADDAESFISHCDAALGEGAAGAEARIHLAEANSWPWRVSRLMELIEEKLFEKRTRSAAQ